ncbi:unnamed protein product [Didymodactylos carnosus]|uniref:PABS domain-containing protein n=1 Tax=Didymodactylos carnosus TaxID=1234261 RepID=A0A8S2MCW4_9BILA|nr:unnamed protein product [Didymodactylos carnosus]CAF3950675.1 unnamed protein product [Didymodactylos carnosus]
MLLYILFFIIKLIVSSIQQPQQQCNCQRQYVLIGEARSNLSLIQVYQSNSIRELRLNTKGTNTIESSIDLDRPLDSVHQYANTMMIGLIWNMIPRHILIIGLGAGILPRILRSYYPLAQIDIVEIDPNILDVARDYFDFQSDSRMNVIIHDARYYIRTSVKKYDIIFSDAFLETDEGTPYHLKTVGFLSELKRIMADDGGVLVSNLHRRYSDYNRLRQTYSFVYQYNYAFLGKGKCNYAILASVNERITYEEMLSRARHLQDIKRFRFNLTAEIIKLEIEEQWNKNSDVLKDSVATSHENSDVSWRMT